MQLDKLTGPSRILTRNGRARNLRDHRRLAVHVRLARASESGLLVYRCRSLLTADETLPLVKHLTLPERARLIALIGASAEDDAAAYRVMPTRPDEFSSDADPLAWNADGWENLS